MVHLDVYSRQTLLTAKLARMLQRADDLRAQKRRRRLHAFIVSVLADEHATEIHTHYLSAMLNIENNIACHSQVGPALGQSICFT
jgi:hypothetical protein